MDGEQRGSPGSPRGGPRCASPSPAVLSSEFAVKRLKMAGSSPGLYLLRRSPQDFDSYLLTVCAEVRPAPAPAPAGDQGAGTAQHGAGFGAGRCGCHREQGGKGRAETWCSQGPRHHRRPFGMGTTLGLLRAPAGQEGLGGGSRGDPTPLSLALALQTPSGQDYKRCLIRRDEDGNFWLSGVARRFCSLRELLGTYGRCGLQAEGARMRLAACCPPLPKGDTATPRQGTGQGCATPWRCDVTERAG